MFGIGGPELIVIIVLALILVGPDQLPKVVKTVGSGVRDLRRMANLAQAELRETVDDLVRDIEAEPEDLGPAEKARAEAQRRAAAALAAARARGADGPPAAIEPTANEPSSEGDAAAAEVAIGDGSAPTANAPPTPPSESKAQAAAPIPLAEARALAEDRVSKRREIGQLLAEEAARLQASRAKALADADHLGDAGLRGTAPGAATEAKAEAKSQATVADAMPAPAPQAAARPAAVVIEPPVDGAVPRGAPPARPGSLAAAIQRGEVQRADLPGAGTLGPARPTAPAPPAGDEDDA